MKVNNTTISLNNLRFYAYHGVLEQESRVGNEYELSLVLRLDATPAMQSDNLSHTVSYADVYNVLQEEMALPAHLLEHLVGRIMARLQREFPLLTGATCSITKLVPPIPSFDSSGVTFTAEAQFK